MTSRFEMIPLCSGSSGNSYYVGTDKVSLLLDAGISMKRIDSGLGNLGLSLRDIDGVLITHEHIDHVKSLGSMARKYNIPIYATKLTLGLIETKLEEHGLLKSTITVKQ